jgi:hypothetical protein
MTHYYYSSPLKAAWMVKRWGLKIEGVGSSLIVAAIKALAQLVTGSKRKLYIDQGTSTVLDPEVGDRGMDLIGNDYICTARNGWEMTHEPIPADYENTRYYDYIRVYRRRGWPFFRPEEEA